MKKNHWSRLLIGFIAIFALFQWSGEAFGSDRGQAGVSIGLLIVAAALGAQRFFFSKSFGEAFFALGLGPPAKRGIFASLAVCLLLLSTIPVFASVANVSFGFYEGSIGLAPGLFFQAGIAEETLFRAYLFGHLRRRYSFWKAAGLAAIPFILVHSFLFYQLSWVLAAASILLAVAMSFPLARLFEMSGGTIWGAAFLHFVAQSTVKILVAEGESAHLFPFFWIAACAFLPQIVHGFPRGTRSTRARLPAFE
ncbi:MAG TPA: type II CAAX endopeptidase family protein [Pyrinomonadaceae bacterium]|jgi:membrane protease YdiL (CAAX protease family)